MVTKQQTIKINAKPIGGTFTIGCKPGRISKPIPYDANDETINAVIRTLYRKRTILERLISFLKLILIPVFIFRKAVRAARKYEMELTEITTTTDKN